MIKHQHKAIGVVANIYYSTDVLKYVLHFKALSIANIKFFEDNDEIRLLKGFINASVSFELLKRGRPEASQRVWKNYLKYKGLLYKIESPYLKEYHFIFTYIESIKT